MSLLVKNGVHFGHQTWRWNPKMAPYIWGQKGGVHLIDVSKTAFQLEAAAKFLEAVATSGQSILWVGTKKAASSSLLKVLENVSCPSVTHRWIGGTLTNWPQVKKSVTKMLHLEDVLAKSSESHYTKKELNVFQKITERLQNNVGGIRKMAWPIGALVVVDVKKEHVAVKEAIAAGVPIVALVDTNSDPSGISYVIPTNDDAPRAITVVLQYLADATQRGLAVAANKPQTDEFTSTDSVEKMLQYALGSDEGDGKTAPKGAAGAKRAPRPRRSPAARGGGSRSK